MAINYTALFNTLKSIFSALEGVNTAQGTTVPPLIDSIITTGAVDPTDDVAIASQLVENSEIWSRNTQLLESLREHTNRIIIRTVVSDAPQVRADIEDSLDELIRQMLADAQTVRENLVTPGLGATPAGNPPLFLVTLLDGDGKSLEQVLPELIVAAFNGETSLLLTSGDQVTERLLWTWPGQSEISTTLTIDQAGVLLNPSFDFDSLRPNTPDNWVLFVASIPGTVTMTQTEVQTITISGTPTSGTYTINLTRTDGSIQTTTPLAFNAGGSEVQSALAALTGMATVEVTTAGTSPNFVHTVNYNAVSPPGDQPALTTDNTFDVGSIAIAEVAPGDDNSKSFRALIIIGDGLELTNVRQPLQNLGLETAFPYAMSLNAKRTSLATGTLEIELTDGEGNVLQDNSGQNNRRTVDINTELSDSDFQPVSAFFRLPSVVPDVIYLQLRLSTAINSGQAIYLDELVLQPCTQLYPELGPFVASAPGDRLAQAGDRYELDIANTFAGRIQTWFSRLYERQLPSATSGSETISDT